MGDLCQKISFLNDPNSKNMVFGRFLELGAADQLDIAYFDRTKLCTRLGHHINHAEPSKNNKNVFFE